MFLLSRTQSPACKKAVQELHRARKISDQYRLSERRADIALDRFKEKNQAMRQLFFEDLQSYTTKRDKVAKSIEWNPYGDPFVAWGGGDERDRITREKHREARKKAGWSEEPKIDQAFAMYVSNRNQAINYRAVADVYREEAVRVRKKIALVDEPVKVNYYRLLEKSRQISGKSWDASADWHKAYKEKYKACGYTKESNLPPWTESIRKPSRSVVQGANKETGNKRNVLLESKKKLSARQKKKINNTVPHALPFMPEATIIDNIISKD